MPEFAIDPELRKYALWSILNQHKDKNFVQRILNPEGTPGLPMPEEGEGMWGTHLMTATTTPEGVITYPRIIQENEKSPLKKLSYEDALEYALKNKQYITFPSIEDANWFGRNYKEYWK